MSIHVWHSLTIIIQKAQLHIANAIKIEMEYNWPTSSHTNAEANLSPDAFKQLVYRACKRLFKNVPTNDSSPVATRSCYIHDFIHLAIIMIDMYAHT